MRKAYQRLAPSARSPPVRIQTGHLAPGIYPIAPRRSMVFVGICLFVLQNCKDRVAKCRACHENCKDRITGQNHQVLRLPRKLQRQNHQMLCLPHKMQRQPCKLPSSLLAAADVIQGLQEVQVCNPFPTASFPSCKMRSQNPTLIVPTFE